VKDPTAVCVNPSRRRAVKNNTLSKTICLVGPEDSRSNSCRTLQKGSKQKTTSAKGKYKTLDKVEKSELTSC
jgi:hypothetical protein